MRKDAFSFLVTPPPSLRPFHHIMSHDIWNLTFTVIQQSLPFYGSNTTAQYTHDCSGRSPAICGGKFFKQKATVKQKFHCITFARRLLICVHNIRSFHFVLLVALFRLLTTNSTCIFNFHASLFFFRNLVAQKVIKLHPAFFNELRPCANLLLQPECSVSAT